LKNCFFDIIKEKEGLDMNKYLRILLKVWNNNIFKVVFFSGFVTLSFFLLPIDTRNVLIPAVIGFFLSSLLTSLLSAYKSSREDKIKSKQDEAFMNEVYPEEKALEVNVNGKMKNVYYKVLYENNGEIEFTHNDTKFELDELFKTYYFDILKSHSNSYIKNVDTLRLVDLERDKLTNKLMVHTQRTDYFDHLLTNRAIDFPIRGKASLRHIFESGPKLRDLKDSEFANQIGYNCLVVLSDNTTILPRRSKNATYSKNKVTASLTGRLPMTIKTGSNEEDLKAFVFEEAKRTLAFKDEILSDSDFKISSITQNLYEGGKPQFYFVLRLNNFSSEDYYKLRNNTLELNEPENKLDRNIRLHITDIDSIKLVGKKDKIQMKNMFERKSRIKVTPEKSFFVNYNYITQN
jgi:hypothetical protein